ncbi:DNA polymerase III subunit epsilon [Bifidobacterium moukalabense]|uniref:DNA polymerase III subunit epsilon n=1 Tax=Bifidobacterium moukalabense TaxID=1333651 RepID=UPI0010F6A9C2|nr:DNA polymerase III subunit epsilon [Bifidobacterium moukalabense]
MNEAVQTGRSWLSEARNDIDQWSAMMPKNADNQSIDWRWVASLDMEHGIGAAATQHIDLLAMLQYLRSSAAESSVAEACVAERSIPSPSARQLHDLLQRDLAIRDRLESILAQCNTTFMTDFDRLIASYRLPRALAYANRRLCDEIAVLREIGVLMHLWTVTEERRERVTVPVLHPYIRATDAVNAAPVADAANGDRSASVETSESVIQLDDIQDRTAEIVNGRAARRKATREQERSGRYDMSRANLSGVTSPGGSTLFDDDSGSSAGRANRSEKVRRLGDYRKPDWRDAYLPGRDIDDVMGIDIETTGTDPARTYIIDVGFEFMNMISSRPADAPAEYRYEQSSYAAGNAYGQARLSFGVTSENAAIGNDLILGLTGIDVRTRAEGFRLFDEWPAAQIGLLQRLEQQPYVAHNARFEHGFFMLNVAGYAESYRAGNITIIDTLPMSRRWDDGSIPDDKHPYGDNTLESYAKRQGALDSSNSERHLGLEDAHIMLVAMKHHLAMLRAEGRGPWGADGRSGLGGKHCGRRW